MDILLVEDNKRISDFVMRGLTEFGFNAVLCEDGISAREHFSHGNWDAIILDIMLPGIDGITLLQYARFKNIKTPILVISALGEVEDKVKALDAGADDYLSKPFHFKELIARVNALVRRTKLNFSRSSSVLEIKGIELDISKHRVLKNNNDVKLTMLEFKLLKLLMENLDRVVPRTEILSSVWGNQYETNTNIVDVYISYLRNKIETAGERKIIETVKGIGYLIRRD